MTFTTFALDSAASPTICLSMAVPPKPERQSVEAQALSVLAQLEALAEAYQTYISFFNSGKRSLMFVHDYIADQSSLRLSSDDGKTYNVTSGYFAVILDANEIAWAQACWQAARKLTGNLWRKA